MGLSSNRFDLIRLILASLVFIYHAIALSSARPPSPLELQFGLISELAIQSFFIVSGALVYGSFERSSGLSDYAGKRIRRLYPAYAVIILVPAAIAASLNVGDGAAAEQIIRYVAANLVFLNFLAPTLPGFFESNWAPEVNGALWTLKIEVAFYLILPILAWGLAKMGRQWWIGIAGLVAGALIWQDAALALDHPLSAQLSRQLPGQMMYFAAGMALWRLWPVIKQHALACLLIGTVALSLALTIPTLDVLRVLGLSGLVAGVAFVPGPALNAARWGDISYGVYIIHFPIVQALVAAGLFATLGLWAGIALSGVIVYALSYMLWWWVEKPALRQDSHYRQVSMERARG